MDKDKKYNLKIVGEGLTYEVEIDSLKVGHIMKICLSKTASVTSEENSDLFDTELSCPEYYKMHNAKNYYEKILVFSGYRTEILGEKIFNPEDLVSYFQQCGEKIPRNFKRDFKKTIKDGWITSAKEAGKYYITKTGRETLSGLRIAK